MDSEQIVAAVRAQPGASLVALDFDGTLAPIVPDPSTSRPAPGVIEALAALTRRGVRVAVVTGREAGTAVTLGGLDAVPGITVAGLYGQESWCDGRLETVETPPVIALLRQRLPAVVAAAGAEPGVWIEDKRLSLVVHTRPAADPVGALHALRGPVRELCDELGLECHDGRLVLEVRLPGFDKGSALRRLVQRFASRVVLYAGDDLGDLPAFAEVARLREQGLTACSVAAASAELPELAAAADLTVAGPAGLVDLLVQLV